MRLGNPKLLDFFVKFALKHALHGRGPGGAVIVRKLIYGLACLSLAACGDPVAEFPRLSEQDLPADAATADIAAAPAPQGASLFELLLGDRPDTTDAPDVTAANTDTPLETHTLPDNDTTQTSPETADPADPALATATPEPKRTGLLALLTRAAPPKDDVIASSDESQAVKVALMEQSETQPDPATDLADTPALADTQDPALGTKHKSMFGINAAKSPANPAAAASEIPPGTVLPYGKLARVCGVPKRDMGKKVAQFPDARPKHRIYDSAPGATGPRTFYVTGFDDGCARQFTASLAMFGSVVMHEQLRYGLPSDVQPYSDTDKAYEKLKSRVCNVPRKKPCGSKVSRMEKNTVFLSIYERFGSNSRWKNLLLHDGEVLAQDIKGG